jgi:hypothetical protein
LWPIEKATLEKQKADLSIQQIGPFQLP